MIILHNITIITGLDVEPKKALLSREVSQVSTISTSPRKRQMALNIIQKWRKFKWTSDKKDCATNQELEMKRLELKDKDEQRRHDERKDKRKCCICVAVIIAIVVIVIAIVGGVIVAVVYITNKNNKSVEDRNKPQSMVYKKVPRVGPTALSILKCPVSDVVVYLTKERQEVPLEGATDNEGQQIPSLTYRPVIFDKSAAEYAAPAKFIITKNSVGKTFPIEVKLKDVEGNEHQCRYYIKVKGK